MKLVTFKYKNHRGEIAMRRVVPDALTYRATPVPEYGHEPGWYLSGFDLDKSARRSFALTNIIVDGLRQTSMSYDILLRDSEHGTA